MRRLWIRLGHVLYRLSYAGQLAILPLTRRARVLLVVGDEVLVVRAFLSDGRWQLPGGGIKHGETPAHAAQRELAEETGIQLGLERFSSPQSVRFREGLKSFPYELFIVELDQTIRTSVRWPEIVAAQWLRVNELNAQNASSDVLNAVAAKQPKK